MAKKRLREAKPIGLNSGQQGGMGWRLEEEHHASLK